MSREHIIRLVAGLFVLTGLSLGAQASPLFVSPWFLLAPAFTGVNLLVSALTSFCPLETMLGRFGVGQTLSPAPARRHPVD